MATKQEIFDSAVIERKASLANVFLTYAKFDPQREITNKANNDKYYQAQKDVTANTSKFLSLVRKNGFTSVENQLQKFDNAFIDWKYALVTGNDTQLQAQLEANLTDIIFRLAELIRIYKG